MLPQEARWIGARTLEIGVGALSPMLDVASGTEEFRTLTQPWIDDLVFAPFRAAGGRAAHLDIEAGPGIDLVGDLADPDFFAFLAAEGFRSVLCANLLEHVPEPAVVAGRLVALLPEGGHLLVTCPRRFPYHPDPIDTMLRPTVGELAGLFPGADFVEGEEVPASNLATTYAARALRSPRFLRRAFGHSGAAGVGAAESRPLFDTARWLFRRLSVTCVVLRRPG